MTSTRWVLTFLLGVAMIAIGLVVALRPLWTHNAVLTGARWLDMSFAIVFMLRGVVNIRTASARRKRRSAQGYH